MTYATVTKWGNSLGVRIPQAYAAQIGFKENTQISMEMTSDSIVLKKRGMSLDELLSDITPNNRHELIDFGADCGKEII